MRKPRVVSKRVARRRLRIPPPGGRHAPGVVFGVVIKGVALLLPERVVVVAAADGAAHADLAVRSRAVRVRIVGPCAAPDSPGAVGVVAVVVMVLVGQVDGRVGLLVVRCQREGRLVGVDVLVVELRAVVTWQAVVPLVVLEGPDAEEGCHAEEDAVLC